MPSRSEITEQVAYESERRRALGVPAAAGGVLFLLAAILVNAVLSGYPTVGLLQALSPALHGERKALVSPHAAGVRYLSHHSLGLIAGSALDAIAVIALLLVLLLFFNAIRFRNPNISPVGRTLVLVGAIGVAVLSIALQVVRAVRTHEFAVGHDFSTQAVENALTKGTLNATVGYLALLAPLVLAIGMIMVIINATRVGLITRWLRGLGIAAAIVILPLFAGIFYLQLVPAAWLVFVGMLFMGRLPSGDPPAWAAGEAMPWPSQAQMRAEAQQERQEAKGRRSDAATSAKRAKAGQGAGEGRAAAEQLQSGGAPAAGDVEQGQLEQGQQEQPQQAVAEPAQPSERPQGARRRRKRR